MATSDTEAQADAGKTAPWSGWDATRIVTVVAIVLVAGALAAGAAIIGDPGRGDVDDPAAYVRSFYEEGDVAGLLQALAPGSVPEDQLAQAERDLGQLLRPEVEVVGTRELQLDDATITEVTTSDRLTWCVDRSGTLYVRCRMGRAAVEVQAGDQPLEATLAQADVYPEQVELVLGLTATGAEPFTFEGELQLEGLGEGEVELAETLAGSNGEIRPIEPTQFELTGDRTMFLVWRGAREAITGRTLTLTWDGGSLELDVGEVEWLS